MAICVIDKDNNCRANKSVDRRKEKRSYLTVCPLYTMGGRATMWLMMCCGAIRNTKWAGWNFSTILCRRCRSCSVEIFSKWQVNDVGKYRTTCRAVNQQMKRRLNKSNSTLPDLPLFPSPTLSYIIALSLSRLGLFWQVIMKMFWVIETKAKPGQVNQTMGQHRQRMTTTVGFQLSGRSWAWAWHGQRDKQQHVEMLPIEALEKCQH